jgi:hypothetical protein
MCCSIRVQNSCSPRHEQTGEDSFRIDHYDICDTAIANGRICPNANDTENRVLWTSDDQFEIRSSYNAHLRSLDSLKDVSCWDCMKEEPGVVFHSKLYEDFNALIKLKQLSVGRGISNK